ncbi:MAG TPA: hypothetical protein VF186_00930 [Gaiellaceae bacterium]
MVVAVWVALGIGVVAATGGAVLAVVHGLSGWRRFRRASSSLTRALGDLAANAATTGEHAATTVDGAAALADANARLERSLAELRVLRRAAGRGRAGVGRIRGAVPRK